MGAHHRDSRRLTVPTEPMTLWLLKAMLHLGAVTLYLIFFVSPWALVCSLISTIVALIYVKSIGARLSKRGIVLFGLLSMFAAWGTSSIIEEVSLISHLLSVQVTLRLSDCLFFSFISFGVVFILRAWGTRHRVGGVAEGIFILISVVQLFASHRNGQIHEPRFFTDWVLIGGHHNMSWWLTLFGAGVGVSALLMMVRVRRIKHFIFALIALALFFGLAILGFKMDRAHKVAKPLTLGGGQGEGKDKDKDKGDGKGDGEEDGDNSQSPPPRPPTPVAVAIFHDDYQPENGILYFRQQALSMFDGVKLVSDPTGQYDADVITRFPYDSPIIAKPTQVKEAHLLIPTSMFLLDEHPTPPMLTHGVETHPLDNPDPQRFVAAYRVSSRVPAVPLVRHVGKDSISPQWTDKQREYYLDTHNEDPRYFTLSSEIVRELPSHLSADPIRRAIAIKRYLEREGYYTLKEKHRSSKDPAASFLFGDMRGYCVHFAHSAAHLLRSQGIAARVALGYAVDARTRSNSSAVVITGDRAHAWPEIHITGVGWVTFDIYPEQSDEPPPSSVSQSLESLFGEIARNQTQRGLERSKLIPWEELAWGTLIVFLSCVFLGYFISFYRILRVLLVSDEVRGRLGYVMMLDRMAGAGLYRKFGESREAYALRLESRVPSLILLTSAHLQWALGNPKYRSERGAEVYKLSKQARKEYARLNRGRWFLSHINPISWWWSR